MTEIASSRAKDKLERKLVLHSSEEPYNKTGNLPVKKMWPVVVHSLQKIRKTYFQKFNLLFAGHFDLAWESDLELIHHFAI